MKNQNEKSKQVYLNSSQLSVFSYQFLIPIILIIIFIVIGYGASKNKTNNYKFEAVKTEVQVIDSSGANPASQSVQNKPTDDTGQQLGPATVEDLGGNSGSTNVEELLKDKQIEVNK